MAGTAALGLFRELRTQPTRSRLRTSRRGQVEHRPVATSPASARPPRLAHSKRATSCRKGSSTRPRNPRSPQPGQVRVIPPPRPRPRTAPRFVPVPASRHHPPAPSLPAPGSGPRPLRRPPEHHPLQDRQVSPQLPHLSVPVRITLAELPDLGLPLRVPLTEPRVLRPQPGVLIQRRGQRIPQRRLSPHRIREHARRNRHAAQQTSSAAANHASCAVSQPTATNSMRRRQHPVNHATSEYLR